MADERLSSIASEQPFKEYRELIGLNQTLVDGLVELNKQGRNLEINLKGASSLGETVRAQKAIADYTEKQRVAEVRLQQAREKAFDDYEKKLQKAELAQQKQAAATAKLSNEYEQLKVKQKAAADEALRLGAAYGQTDARFLSASKNAKKLNDELFALERSTGNSKRGVGEYERGFNSLGFSIRNIAGELPNLGISIRTFAQAISNNIGPLKEAIDQAIIANRTLQAEGKPTVSVGRQIAASVFSWQTAILAAVAAITYLVSNMKKEDDEATKLKKTLEEQAKAQKELSDSQASSIGTLQTLYTISQDQTRSMKQRTEAVKDLQKEYPAYFASLSTEAILAGRAANAYLELRDALISSATSKIYQERINEALSKELDLADKIADKQKQISKLGNIGSTQFDSKGRLAGTTSGDPVETQKSITLNGELKDLLAEQANQVRIRSGYLDKIEELDVKRLRRDPVKEKTVKDKKQKDEEDLTKYIYEEQQKRAEAEAVIQKAIADDDTKTLQERLQAYDRYSQKKLEAAGFSLSAEYEAAKGVKEKEADLIAQYELVVTEVATDNAKFRADETEKELKRIDAARKKYLSDNYANPEYKPRKDRGKAILDLDDNGKDRLRQTAAYADAAVSAIQGVNQVLDQLSQRRIQAIQNEIDAIDTRTQKEVDAVNKSVGSEEEKAQKIAEINARAQAKKDGLAEKAKAEQRKAAERQKALDIAQIIIKTALAVVTALATPPAPVGAALAIAAGVAGAAELAVAIATPIPAFKDGVQNFAGGLAIVGDGDQREPILGADGSLRLSSNRPEVTMLNKGDSVFPSVEDFLKSTYGMATGFGLVAGHYNEADNSDVVDELKAMTKKLANTIDRKEAVNIKEVNSFYTPSHYDKLRRA